MYYDRIDVSEIIVVNKTSESKDCDICHYWYFLNKGFKFQLNVCNRHHDLLMMSMNLSNVAILDIKGFDCRCVISRIIKIIHIPIKKHRFVPQKRNIINIDTYLLHIKMGKGVLTFGDTEIEKNILSP